jgi:predicted RNase H-like HicB family nuclease
VAIHTEVLGAARRLCVERGGWTFTVEEVVRALPHLNEHSVRAHVSSRCCVNAPANHTHRWPYFRRLARGRYEITKAYRIGPRAPAAAADAVAAGAELYGHRRDGGLSDVIHAVLRLDGRTYVAECLEIAVVTQADTVDEVLENLEDAIALHLEGEDASTLGLVDRPRLSVTYEVPLRRHAAKA